MPVHENVQELAAYIDSRTDEILLDYVAPVVEEILLKNIENMIYGTYTPQPGAWVNGTTYQRRRLFGDHMVRKIEEPGLLAVTSNAAPSDPVVKGARFLPYTDGAFLGMLENGDMGIWRSGFPRPAVSSAQKEVYHSLAVQIAIRSGLERLFG